MVDKIVLGQVFIRTLRMFLVNVGTEEKFYIFKETRINNQINYKNTVKPNTIFEALLGPYKGKD
jgi:hypothetical protein